MLQSVFIPRYEERTLPSPHTVYEVRVKANVRDWSLWRRYSEFDDLHSALKDAAGEPPAPLPSKHSLSIFRSHSDPKLLEEHDKWRETFAFREFLGIPIGKHGEIPQSGQFTLASWLDEHIDLQTRIRDVRADLNKRDALSDRGDTNGAHTSNLAVGLQELAMGGMSEGELQRRTDMIARLRDDCENRLGKMVTVARMTSRVGGGGAAARNPASDTDREVLMGGSTSSKPFGRAKMQQQDSEVSQLTSVLQRQRHLGEAISNELAIQIELLDDLSNRVDETQSKLATTTREMGRLK
ncbi:syntaxin [Mycena leptocephala]|nr:syntaxin [Mycena leptocephala]